MDPADSAANGNPRNLVCLRNLLNNGFLFSDLSAVPPPRFAPDLELLLRRPRDNQDKMWSKQRFLLVYGIVCWSIWLGCIGWSGTLRYNTSILDPSIQSNFSKYKDFDPRALTPEFLELAAFLYRNQDLCRRTRSIVYLNPIFTCDEYVAR